MIENSYDVRMFGAVMASKLAPAGKTRGPSSSPSPAPPIRYS